MVLNVFDDWYSVPFVKNSQKTVKTAKMTIGVPIVTTNRHMSTHSPPNTQSRANSAQLRYLAKPASHVLGQWPQPVARGQG